MPSYNVHNHILAVRFYPPVLASESLISTTSWSLTSKSEKVIIGCEAKTVNGKSQRSNVTVNILKDGGKSYEYHIKYSL